ncbi:MAG: hypothetical protein WCK78_09455 [Paludibacter sp.]|jgi:hypothetical protein
MNTIQFNNDLNFQQLVDIVNRLSPSEKLKLNECLWAENMEIPIEHQEIVLSRIQKSKEKPERLLDWDLAAKTIKH